MAKAPIWPDTDAEARKLGEQTLRNFDIPQHLSGEVFIGKSAVLEPDHFAGNLPMAISYQIHIDRPQHRKGDSPDHRPVRPVVEKSLLHPPATHELLRHVPLPQGPPPQAPPAPRSPHL